MTHDIDEAIFLSDRIQAMTAPPGTLKSALPVFITLRTELLALQRDESMRAVDPEIDGTQLSVSRTDDPECRTIRDVRSCCVLRGKTWLNNKPNP